MQRHTWHLVVGSVVGLVALIAVPRASAQTGTIRCESVSTSREQCAIERGARVELVRHLSETPCHQNANWGVGEGFLWVSRGCRADFLVTAIAANPPSHGNAAATPIQLRACRSEADRRLSRYSYAQIEVEPYSRQGSTAWVRWIAGTTEGMCTVATNGRILQFTTAGAGGGGTGMPGTTRITCESRSNDRQECRIPEGARIRLLRQLSQSPCRLNDTYGRGAGYLWVAEGCGGEFEVRLETVAGPGGPAGGGTARITCESTANARRECPIPAGATARFVAQTSHQPCTLHQTYGLTITYIWVAAGCRGVFEVTRGGVSSGDGATTTRITCESRGGDARQQCAVAGATGVRLVRQIGISRCSLDETYGIGFGHLWVSNGCRGEFDVTVDGAQPDERADSSGLPASPGLADRVICESKGVERTACPIRSGGQVRLVRQLSAAACIQNSTWGTGSGALWVTRGCRGEFEVR